MKRTLYFTGLITLLLVAFGTTFSIAQSHFGLRLQFGDRDRTVNNYYTDLSLSYRVPYDVICEMHYAGIMDEDMPTILYIKAHSPYSLRQIYSLRARGATWEQLSNWCGVPLGFDTYRPYDHHNGPPYGNAYGYYKNHQGRYYGDCPDNGNYGKHFRKHHGHDRDND